MRTFRVLQLVAIFATAFIARVGYGQTFTVAPKSGPGPFTVTWDSQGGSNCAASGITDWTGTIAASGTKQINGPVGDLTITISCAVPVKGNAVLNWVNPTANTDNSPLTDLAGTRILYGKGQTAADLSVTATISNPGIQTYTIDNLDPGTWYFAAASFSASGHTSEKSPLVSKVITAATKPWTATQTFTVVAPNPPTQLRVTKTDAFQITTPPNRIALSKVGTVPLKTLCDPKYSVLTGYNVVDRNKVKWNGSGKPSTVVAKCG